MEFLEYFFYDEEISSFFFVLAFSWCVLFLLIFLLFSLVCLTERRAYDDRFCQSSFHPVCNEKEPCACLYEQRPFVWQYLLASSLMCKFQTVAPFSISSLLFSKEFSLSPWVYHSGVLPNFHLANLDFSKI